MPVRHVLFDADGVLQTVAGGWQAALEPVIGPRWEEFGREAGSLEGPSLRGEEDFLDVVARLAAKYGVDRTADDVHAHVWRAVHVEPSSIELVRRVRDAGYGVHLGSNQHARRAAYLRRDLGYEDLFDTLTISCEIGVAKPDQAFFEHAVATIGAPAQDVLMLDDVQANVDGALTVGLRGVQWSLREPHDVLLERLAAAGVRVSLRDA